MYTNASRLDRLREFVFVMADDVPLLYWITPKAAHTTIVNRLLRRPPFRIVEVVGASLPEAARRAKLREVLRSHEPLEFTFVREPVGQLVSALDQMRFCRGLPTAASLVDYLTIFDEFVGDRWPSTRCRELHLYPQVAGYPAPGFTRLHFVGHVASLRTDWVRLLRGINASADARRPVQVVNRRDRPAFLDSAAWTTLATHPAVRAHTEWDARCGC